MTTRLRYHDAVERTSIGTDGDGVLRRRRAGEEESAVRAMAERVIGASWTSQRTKAPETRSMAHDDDAHASISVKASRAVLRQTAGS